MTSLLPPNATALERRITQAAADLERADAPLHTLWDAKRIPAHLLPWLAWAVGVDDWSRHWPESAKRAAIAEAIPIRRRRGTPWALRRALEVLGYTDVDILEHAKQDAEWQAAGGLYLDATWPLDSRDMVPENAPRVVTVHWAQYALGFNIADAPFRVADQRLLRRRIDAVAPLRSELVALIYRYTTAWNARIGIASPRQRVRFNWADCAGARVPRARPIMGCWSLSGDYAPVSLDATQRLGGRVALAGKQPIGEPLNQGWGTLGIGVRQRSHLGCLSTSTHAWTLGETSPDRLNGRWSLNEILGEHRAIGGGWPIGAAALHQPHRPRLNGARLLGAQRHYSGAGTTATAWARQRRLKTEIHLDHGRPATTVPWRHWINTGRYTRLTAEIGLRFKHLGIRLPVGFGAQAASRNTWQLGDTLDPERVNRLDARWALDETLDAHRQLAGSWQLSLAQLSQPAYPVTLAGARTLGHQHTLGALGTTATATHKDRRHIQEIRL